MEERLAPLFQDVVASYPFIFDEQEAIELEPRVAAYIVSELQFLSLLHTQTDVKGDAYEELVGANLRADRGEFFTPRNVCDMAVNMAMALHPKDRLTSLKVLDCCCGTGGFLVSWLNNVLRVLREQEASRPAKGAQATPDVRARERIREVCSRNLFGIDINPFLVKTCQMNLVLHGDGSSNVYRADSVRLPGEWDDVARKEIPFGKVDIVFTNPPFGGQAKIDDAHVLSQHQLPSWDNVRRNRASMPAEQLFVESAMRFLKPGGHLVIVLPNGILSNPSNRFIRSWLLKRSQLRAVVDLPETTFAASKGVNHPSVIVVRKLNDQEAEYGVQPPDYELFMAKPMTAGITKRAKPIYLRNPSGQEKVDEGGRRIRNDEVSSVADEFRRWNEGLSR